MSKKNELIQYVDFFYSEVLEEYKEIVMSIRRDATPMAIFRKKHYQEHIDKLKACKKKALGIPLKGMDISPGEGDAMALKEQFMKSIMMFASLCDHQIQVQTSFQNVADKKGGKLSVSSEANRKMNQHNLETQKVLHELDILYADLLQEE